MRTGELLNHDGKLAQYRWSRTLPERPAIETTLAVAKRLPAEDYPAILGQVPWSPGGSRSWDGEIRTQFGGRVIVDTTGWDIVKVVTDVPKPRDGRTYTWKWDSGSMMSDPQWREDYYRVCPDCNRQHKPGKCKA